MEEAKDNIALEDIESIIQAIEDVAFEEVEETEDTDKNPIIQPTCPFCNKIYASKLELDDHYEKAHSEEMKLLQQPGHIILQGRVVLVYNDLDD